MPQLDSATYMLIAIFVIGFSKIIFFCIKKFIVETYWFQHRIKPMYLRFLAKAKEHHYAVVNANKNKKKKSIKKVVSNYQDTITKIKSESTVPIITPNTEISVKDKDKKNENIIEKPTN